MKRIVKTGVYTYNGEEHTFNFYTSLRAVDKLKFVKGVSNSIIEDDYNSVIRHLIFDFMIINTFTDVDISEIENAADSISKIEDFLLETNIVEIVKANAEIGLIEELNNAVDDNIEYRTGIHKNPLTESLSRLLNTIEKKVSGVDTDGMMKMAEVIGSMTGELTPEKIVEAYANSDLFKKRLNEVQEEKKKHNVEVEKIGKALRDKKISVIK